MSRFEVTLLWTARYDYEKGQRLEPHKHACCQMLWIADGSGVFYYEGSEYPLERGTIFYIHPNKLHGLQANTSVKTLDIKFELRSPEISERVSGIPHIIQDKHGKIGALMDHIRREGAQREPYYTEMANLYLLQILYQLARWGEQPVPPVGESYHPGEMLLKSGETVKAAEQVERWLVEHYNEDWTVADMAKQLGYSTGHLRQVFKAYKGSSIPAFLKAVRMEQAKEWMRYSDLGLKHIAEQVGFKTIHHFTRVFREQEGMTPGQWMDLEKRGIRKSIVFDK